MNNTTNTELAALLRLLAEGVETNITEQALLLAAARLEEVATNE